MSISNGLRRVPEQALPTCNIVAPTARDSSFQQSAKTGTQDKQTKSTQFPDSLVDKVIGRCLLARYGAPPAKVELRILLDVVDWLNFKNLGSAAEMQDVVRMAATYLHWDIPPEMFNKPGKLDGGGT